MTVARDDKTGAVVDPQPDKGERDRYGHLKGCNAMGCTATRCRELMGDESWRDKAWYWSER